jgi:rod shape determining protein RodA
MALVVAERAEGRRHRTVDWIDVTLMLLIAGLPAVLILLQPDLGTMLVLSATVFGVLAVSGAPRRWLVAVAGAAVVGATLVVSLGVLKTYQVNRFMAFTNPDLDPRGAGYNTTQARIAIGNGGLFGQGLFDGSQTRSGFVPEQHTDFVFTVAGEELGLLGAGVLIALFAVLLWRALVIATQAEDMFGRVAAAGIACWLGFQTFQNIGMCLGIMPVTGVPLPLVSYGGSSMFASLVAIGLLLNIQRRSRQAPSSRMPAERVLTR